MEMHQVRYFLAVSEELNFTRAAERCNVAQPSLTRAIKQLEDELGGPLFHRERSNTHLSELGRIMQPHFKQVYSQAQQAKQQALKFAKLNRTPLKLGIMCTIAPTSLLGLVRGLRTHHPGVELQIIDANATSLQDMLLRGDLEVAISCQPEPETDPRLHQQLLYSEQFVIALDEDHPLVEAKAIRVKDLAGERLLERVNCEMHNVAGAIFTEQGVTDQPIYRSERDDWILAMVAAGVGCAFMPEQCARAPGIVIRPLVEPEIWRDVCLTTVRGRPHSPAVGALVREAMAMRVKERPRAMKAVAATA